MAQVIIVSNRLPVSVKKDKGKLVFSPSLGGLATGLSSFVDKHSGNMWVGWPGIASDELSSLDKQQISNELYKQGYIPVFLSQNQVDNFYNGYSNSVLWPLFHGLPFKPIEQGKMDQWWRAYQAVNRRFCETVLSIASHKSQIWVHDYQLLLLPELLRTEQKDANLGFFLHIPFPGPKRYRGLNESGQLLRGMLGANLIGFHTLPYVQNFMKSIKYADLGAVNSSHVTLSTRVVRVAEFPMGIDYEKFAEANKSKNVKSIVKSYKKKYKKLKIIVSVDRLDPSKGLVERLKAYRQFLDQTPKIRGKVVFVMVAAPSRTSIPEYQNLSNRLSKLSQEINNEFGSAEWQPIDYINVPLAFESITALFQIADVAFIAPLRDGMNLAAKEFVASNKRGALILSETAGAAEELKDALIVDPKNPETLVGALDEALKMRKRELRVRIYRMRKHLSTNTVQNWAKTFVDTLQQPLPGTAHITRTLNKRSRAQLLKEYKVAKKRLLLLDYDGSLVPFNKDYSKAKPSESILNLLISLAKSDANDVVLISGRNAIELDEWFGKLPINIVAEHGAAIKEVRGNWQTTDQEDTEWKQLLIPSLEKYADLTPGAKVEIKPHSLVWHYRSASTYHAQKYAVIIKRSLKPVLKKHGLELQQGNKVLEIKNPEVNKGAASKRWLDRPYDFILSIGDDVTDEDLFSIIPLASYSIKVGRGLTKAKYRLANYKEVYSLLKKMT